MLVLELGGVAVSAFVVGLSGAMMPGPLLAVTISEAARRGARAGPLIVLGHMLLEAALVAVVALGFAAVLQRPRVVGVMALAGSAVLCWLGADMVRSARGLSLEAETRRAVRLHPVTAGAVVSLSNPYWTIWWATIGISYIVMGLRFGLAGIVSFFAGHILADLAWYSLVSFGIARGRRFIPDTVYRALVVACGGFLLALGAWFCRRGAIDLAAVPTV
jgi:threonine/homoserine/homoserine lactone efflux protein